jgi:hypothetical protein
MRLCCNCCSSRLLLLLETALPCLSSPISSLSLRPSEIRHNSIVLPWVQRCSVLCYCTTLIDYSSDSLAQQVPPLPAYIPSRTSHNRRSLLHHTALRRYWPKQHLRFSSVQRAYSTVAIPACSLVVAGRTSPSPQNQKSTKPWTDPNPKLDCSVSGFGFSFAIFICKPYFDIIYRGLRTNNLILTTASQCGLLYTPCPCPPCCSLRNRPTGIEHIPFYLHFPMPHLP